MLTPDDYKTIEAALPEWLETQMGNALGGVITQDEYYALEAKVNAILARVRALAAQDATPAQEANDDA